jgi:hypothetical protein
LNVPAILVALVLQNHRHLARLLTFGVGSRSADGDLRKYVEGTRITSVRNSSRVAGTGAGIASVVAAFACGAGAGVGVGGRLERGKAKLMRSPSSQGGASGTSIPPISRR